MIEISDTKVFDALRHMASKERLSWKKIAEMLHVTQNTISNWNNGHRISPGKKQAILLLLDQKGYPYADDMKNAEDPISSMMNQLWPQLSETARARIYAFALELRDQNSFSSWETSEYSSLGEIADSKAKYKTLGQMKLEKKN